mmetsp:Transcript_9805/g.17682  ORF Transcript_9805/g.17682 Transcript_9805/m.17682 type:complete len:193 (-) Transcript_9805:1987-2565(-)
MWREAEATLNEVERQVLGEFREIISQNLDKFEDAPWTIYSPRDNAWLMLSDAEFAKTDPIQLREKYGITHVVNCASYEFRNNPAAHTRAGVQYCSIEAKDTWFYNIMDNDWPTANAFLTAAFESNGGQPRALVHCIQGINRSGFMVAAYLVQHSEMRLLEVVRLLREKRGPILTNRYFQVLLVQLASKLNKI